MPDSTGCAGAALPFSKCTTSGQWVSPRHLMLKALDQTVDLAHARASSLIAHRLPANKSAPPSCLARAQKLLLCYF